MPFDETLCFVAADIIAGEWKAQPITYRKGFFQTFVGDAGLTGHVMRWRPNLHTPDGPIPIPQCDHHLMCPCWETVWEDLPL